MFKDLLNALSKDFVHYLGRRSPLRLMVKNAAWLFGDHILRSALGLAVGIWVARYLGTADYGLLNYAVAFTALAAPLAQLGLQSVVVRDILVHPATIHVTLGSALFLRLVSSAVAVSLLYIVVVVLRPGDVLIRTAVLILAVAGVVQSLSITAWCFESQVSSKNTVVAQNIAFIVGAGFRVALIVLEAPLLAFVLLIGVEMAVSTLAVAIAYQLSGENIWRWRIRATRVKGLLSDSWPFMLSSIAVTIYMKIDIVMLGEMRGNEQAGVYAAALRLSEPWYLIATAIVASAFPYLVRRRGADGHAYAISIGKLCRLLAGLAYGIAIAVTLLSGVLVELLFGVPFADAGPVLAVHIWACHAVFLGVAYNSWISAENLGLYTMTATTVGAILNVSLNWLLIPSYGPLGAAVTTVVSYWFVVFIMPLVGARTRPMGRILISSLLPLGLGKKV